MDRLYHSFYVSIKWGMGQNQLFVCHDYVRQEEVYNYIQGKGLKGLSVENDAEYERLPKAYRKQYRKFLTLPYSHKCFYQSMSLEAVCEINVQNLQDFAVKMKEKRVAFWGAGRKTAVFLWAYKEQEGDINCIIDMNVGKHGQMIEGVEITAYEKVWDLQMEFYRFIPSLIVSDELSLYDNFKENSVDGSSLTLYEYYYQKQRLPHSTLEENKGRIQGKMFFLALYMRNFIETESVLKTMPDNIEYQKQREHSLYFHNAFTVTYGTNSTCKTIFCGIRQVDDLGYRIRYFRDIPQIDEAEHIGTDNSPLLKDIEEQGYSFPGDFWYGLGKDREIPFLE